MVGGVTVRCERFAIPPGARDRKGPIPADFTMRQVSLSEREVALGLPRGPRMPTLPEHAGTRFRDLSKPTGAVCNLGCKYCFFLSIPLHKSPKRLRTSMKTKLLKCAALACVSAALFTLTACSSPQGTMESTAIETADGAIVVDKFTTTATVTGIDAARRELTLMTSNGRRERYKAGPEVVNFDQIRVGDRVKAVLTEEVAVALGKGTAPVGTSGVGVAVAPVGSMPGGVVVDTSEITAKVTAVDARRHKVTFELPDGTTKTVKAGRKVDLSAVQVGETVTMQVGEGLAVSVEKP